MLNYNYPFIFNSVTYNTLLDQTVIAYSNPYHYNLFGSLFDTLLPNQPGNLCYPSSFIIPEDIIIQIAIDNEEFADIISEANDYVELESEYRYYEKEYLYELLRDDTTCIIIDTLLNDSLEQFFIHTNNGTIGEFADFRTLIERGEIERAEELLLEINDIETIETNMLDVNTIYLRSFAEELYDFQTQDESRLNQVAYTLPYYGGDGVYSARAMLGLYEMDEGEVAYRLPNESIESESKCKVFPNPSSGYIYIEFDTLVEGDIVFELYNINGQRIQRSNTELNSNILLMHLTNCTQGMYFYKIISNNESFSGKLIIK